MNNLRTIFRRRKEARTDYKLRLGLIKSGKLRVVIRKTNRYMIIQLVESEIAQDRVIAGVSSKELIRHGWPEKMKGGLKGLGACYLSGMLLAKKIKNKEAILDIGLHRNIKGGRLYAVLKGLVDAGIKIPVGKDSLPSEERVLAKNKELILKIKEKISNG